MKVEQAELDISPIQEIKDSLSLEAVEARIEIEDRTIAFLYKQLEELQADRHFLLGVRKSLLKERDEESPTIEIPFPVRPYQNG